MTLQDSLDKLKERIEGGMPPQIVNIMHQATADLEASGIGEGILKVGDKAPEFKLPNQDGNLVSSTELLKNGPLVVTYYRGAWCPYCNTDLGNLKRYTAELQEFNATMISVSPQIPQYNKQITTQQRLNFDLLSDSENNVANEFGLRWEMVDPLKSLYRDSFGISLPNYNGDESWTLPVPARFIIGTDGIIKYAEFSIDYTKRPNPDVLVKALNEI
ncbi:peroxiredoxin-like family protein [Kordia sp.]|uniref:peroxiredoxin-like family protein n=1 Tax=Kordia sp. TaxID=1965332 RepID=UPI0025C4582C|nr:peroxiredoxin-like family protein [Kordia sp.]MCH2194835.1 AhpC/TSA family protein [Kordia sp.]